MEDTFIYMNTHNTIKFQWQSNLTIAYRAANVYKANVLCLSKSFQSSADLKSH